MKYTIPPATAWAFEKHANQICDRAEVDREDKVLLAYELQSHLQEAWQEGIDLGLNSDQAQLVAIERLGTVKSVARSLNENDLRRFFIDNDARVIRLLVILFYCWAESFLDRQMAGSTTNVFMDLISIPDNLSAFIFALACLYFVARIRPLWSIVSGGIKTYLGKPMSRLLRHPPVELNSGFDQAKSQEGQNYLNPQSHIDQTLAFVTWLGLVICSIAFFKTLVFFFDPFFKFKLLWEGQAWAKPGQNGFRYYLLVVLVMQMAFGMLALLAAISEIFDWPRKKRDGNRTLAWFFYTLPLLVRSRFRP